MSEVAATRLLRSGVCLPLERGMPEPTVGDGEGSAQAVVALARAPWCPANAHLFGEAQRASYACVAQLKYRLCERYPGLVDVWDGRIMVHAIVREG